MTRLLPVLVLASITLAFFGPALVGDAALLPVHTDGLRPWRAEVPPERLAAIDEATLGLGADKTLMFHPQLALALRRLGDGEAPLWNPDNLCGVPLLAQAVHGVFHPPNLLVAALAPARAYGWIAALQVLLAGAFTWWLAREYGVSRWAALGAALVFAYSGFLASRVHWYQIQGASMYLPAGLLGVERLASGRGRWGAVAGTGLVIGLSFLAGFPPSTLYLVYAGAVMAAVRLLGRLGKAGGAGLARRAGRLAFALGLGIALGAPQVLPSAAFASSGESTRRALPPEEVRTLGMRPVSLLTAAAPDLFGHPDELRAHASPLLRGAGSVSRALQKPSANYNESNAGIGAAALVLAGIGAWAAGRARGVGLALAIIGALAALDTDALLVVLRLPGLDTADPRRSLLLFTLGAALLTGAGLDRLVRDGAGRLARPLVVAATMLVALAAAAVALTDDASWAARLAPALAGNLGVPVSEVAAHAEDLALDRELLATTLARVAVTLALCAGGLFLAKRSRPGAATLLVTLAAAELLFHAHRSRTLLPADAWFAPPPALAALTTPDELPLEPVGAMPRANPSPRVTRLHPGAPDPLETPLPPNTGLPFGVRDVSGYITLAPRRVEALHEMLAPGTSFGVGLAPLPHRDALRSPLLAAFAAERVLSSEPLDVDGLQPLGRVGDAWLYRDTRARPRAYEAENVIVARDEDDARVRLAARDFDATRDVVVYARDPTLEVRELLGAVSRGLLRGLVTIVEDRPERVELDVHTHEGGLIVLADSDLPGWTATVDETPAPILTANLAFRAVVVPAGRHAVVFRYDAPGWTAGRIAGLVGVLGLLLAVVLWLRDRRRSRERDEDARIRFVHVRTS